MIEPVDRVINGSGKPRIIAETDTVYTSSTQTSYDDTSVSEANGVAKTITALAYSITVTGALDITAVGIDLNVGDIVAIAGNTTATPSVNGNYSVIQRISADQFLVAYGSGLTFGAGTLGTAQRIVDFTQIDLQANMKVEASFVDPESGATETTYGKVTGIEANKITVDGWSFGTPAGGTRFVVNGFIADLPYCKKLRETFSPDTLVHHLYRGRREPEERGFFYKCLLDYTNYILGDTLFLLKHVLQRGDAHRTILLPRKDAPEFQRLVYLSPDSPVDMSMLGDGIAHQDVAFVFEGEESVDNFPFLEGYGSDYGGSYGDVL